MQSTLDIRVYYYFVVVVCMKCVEHMDKACVSPTAEFTILAPHTREDGRIKQGNRKGGARWAPGPQKFGTQKPSAFSTNARFTSVLLIGVQGPHSFCDLHVGVLVSLEFWT